MAIFGLTIVGMGFSRDGAWLAAAYAVLGLTFAASEVVTSSLWQRMVPDEFRGRVLSTMSTFARVANPIGYVAAGWLGTAFGVRVGLWIGGSAIALLTGITALSRTVRRLDEVHLVEAPDGYLS